MQRRHTLLAGLLLILMGPLQADTRILVTLEWPPYTGIELPEGGEVTGLVKRVFADMGDDTRIGYFSWRRALQLPRTDRRFAATYPMYYAPERDSQCHFSAPIGKSPIGLAERRQQPLSWHSVDDLRRYRIGVVKGYVNSPRFDALVNAGKLAVLAAENDEQNLRNLQNGLVDGAVIDHNLYQWLSRQEAPSRLALDNLQLNPRLLVVNGLYMCFPRDDEGLALRDRFNASLHKLRPVIPGTVAAPPAVPAGK